MLFVNEIQSLSKLPHLIDSKQIEFRMQQNQNQQSSPGTQAPPSDAQKSGTGTSAPANGQPAAKTPTPGTFGVYFK